MKTNYTIKKAHSGTTEKEIEKAKRIFRKMRKLGILYGTTIDSNEIIIEFEDINYNITATFKTEFEKIGDCRIN